MAGDPINGCRFAATWAAVFAAASLASSTALTGQPPAPTSEMRVPDATLVAIPNRGHFAYLECGYAVRSALNNFLVRRQQ